ncbi:MAG: hypothetical protein WEC59_09010 [Salibacteraceae bacterium]
MKKAFIGALIVAIVLINQESNGQCNAPNFLLDQSQCKSSLLSFNSFDSNYVSYDFWIDVKTIDSLPSHSDLGTLGGTIGRTDVTLVEEDGEWYGFYLSETVGQLYRLNFGNSLMNTPNHPSLTEKSIRHFPIARGG